MISGHSTPETQRQVANQVVVWATALGFADPSKMDVDSTIQEANIAYPSDAQLMVKMTLLVNKVWTYVKQNVAFFADFIPTVDVKAVKAKARAYWFRDRQNSATTPSLLQDLWHESFAQISHVRQYFEVLLDDDIDRMPWNIRRAFDQVNAYCSDLFLQSASGHALHRCALKPTLSDGDQFEEQQLLCSGETRRPTPGLLGAIDHHEVLGGQRD